MNRVDIRIGSLRASDPNLMREIERALDALERGVEAAAISREAMQVVERISAFLDAAEEHA